MLPNVFILETDSVAVIISTYRTPPHTFYYSKYVLQSLFMERLRFYIVAAHEPTLKPAKSPMKPPQDGLLSGLVGELQLPVIHNFVLPSYLISCSNKPG